MLVTTNSSENLWPLWSNDREWYSFCYTSTAATTATACRSDNNNITLQFLWTRWPSSRDMKLIKFGLIKEYHSQEYETWWYMFSAVCAPVRFPCLLDFHTILLNSTCNILNSIPLSRYQWMSQSHNIPKLSMSGSTSVTFVTQWCSSFIPIAL